MKAAIHITAACAAALALLVLCAVLDGVALVDQQPGPAAQQQIRQRHPSADLPARRPHSSTQVVNAEARQP